MGDQPEAAGEVSRTKRCAWREREKLTHSLAEDLEGDLCTQFPGHSSFPQREARRQESVCVCEVGCAERASRVMLGLSNMQLAPQVLPVTVTEIVRQLWMPRDPKSSVSQSPVGLVSLIQKTRESGKRHGKDIKTEKTGEGKAKASTWVPPAR